jgi:hypothetical protein
MAFLAEMLAQQSMAELVIAGLEYRTARYN